MWERVKMDIENAWDWLKAPVFIVALTLLIAGVFSPLVYRECAVNARILNETFGTSYTAGDMFWAGETIKTIVALG